MVLRVMRLRVLALMMWLPALAGSAWAQNPPRDVIADAAKVPSVIPLVPLTEVVLFPSVARPLFMVEPSHREAIAEALKGNRVVGIILLRSGSEAASDGPIYEIGCAGEIEDSEQMADGRYYVVLRGLSKFRVLSEDRGRAYRQARVEVMPEVTRDEDVSSLTALRDRLAAIVPRFLPGNIEPPGPWLSDVHFINVTGMLLNMPETTRQDLLERSSTLIRGQALLDILGMAASPQ